MRLTHAIPACVLLSVVACAGPESAADRGPITLSAIVQVKTGKHALEIPIAVINPKSTPFRCAARDGRKLSLASCTLYRGGLEVKDALRRTSDESPLLRDDVLVIPPGGVGRLTYLLPYSDVRPGLYELHIRYLCGTGRPPNGPELTPASFEQRIALDVVAE